jgi:hypothetical protein
MVEISFWELAVIKEPSVASGAQTERRGEAGNNSASQRGLAGRLCEKGHKIGGRGARISSNRMPVWVYGRTKKPMALRYE